MSQLDRPSGNYCECTDSACPVHRDSDACNNPIEAFLTPIDGPCRGLCCACLRWARNQPGDGDPDDSYFRELDRKG
jgi:hypothetical protein